MTASGPAVVVDGLVKRYGSRTVLDGVSLAVAGGELVALLGPNGAGKTTTVEILEGYRRADGGTARVLGVDPSRRAGPPCRVGLMLQAAASTRGRDRARRSASTGDSRRSRDADELLDLVGLRAVADTGTAGSRVGAAAPRFASRSSAAGGRRPDGRPPGWTRGARAIRAIVADLRDAGGHPHEHT
jgi:ABC-2 type transport system ATP-binding protein